MLSTMTATSNSTRKMRVTLLNRDPEILLVRNFVTQDEANALIEAADARLKRSTTVCDKPGGCVVEQRTSSSAAVPDNTDTARIQARGRIFGRMPFAEPLQVVRYGPGEEYKPHLDAFSATDDGGRRAIAQYEGRQREATLLIYLQAPEKGGDTIFPRIGLSVPPLPLAAVYWRNVRPDGSIDERTLHGGAPVSMGTKYAANLWLRGARDSVYALALSESVEAPTEKPRHGKSAMIVACGVGLGAAIGGPPGALVGGAAGWVVDAVRRRFT